MNIAKLSNSFATGGGGVNFEQHVQAVFLLTLLVNGSSPILSQPVIQLDFQGKHLKYDVDDLIITTSGRGEPKILCQIKHDITISKGSTLFQEVIDAAWSEFQKDTFHPERDKIVLATRVITKDSMYALRYIYEQANFEHSEEAFLTRIQQTNFTSSKVREKFQVLREALTKANRGVEVDAKTLWTFCKIFVLLVFDLDYQSSVNRMLILSLIKCQCAENPQNVWGRLFEFAAECNQAGASICLNSIPDDIKEWFQIEDVRQYHAKTYYPLSPSELWIQLALIGSWDERNKSDVQIVEKITGIEYKAIRQTLIQSVNENEPYIVCENRIWKLRNRIDILRLCENFFSESRREVSFKIQTYFVKD